MRIRSAALQAQWTKAARKTAKAASASVTKLEPASTKAAAEKTADDDVRAGGRSSIRWYLRSVKSTRLLTPAEEKQRVQKKKDLQKKLEGVTAAVEKAEARVGAINDLFCDPTFFDRTSRSEVGKLEAEQKTLSEKVESLMGEWEMLEDEMGKLGVAG
jgi:uncharacterized coiled-coil DUF342 family protein